MVSIVTSVSLVVTVVRITINFLEAYSVVGAARRADYQLLTLCERETISSEKLATACRSALADVSSPLVLKAFLHAFRSVFTELVESTATPTRLLALVLFGMSGFGAPVVGALTRELYQKRHRRLVRLQQVVASGDGDGDGGGSSEDDDDDGLGAAARLRVAVARGLRRVRTSVSTRLQKQKADEDLETPRDEDEAEDGVVLFHSGGQVGTDRTLRRRACTHGR
jgi:hypothetical protein